MYEDDTDGHHEFSIEIEPSLDEVPEDDVLYYVID